MALRIEGKPGYVPSRLTHYTNLDGLTGVISSGQFWASNVSFLNDRRELIHGLEASVEAIEKLVSKASYASWKPALDHTVAELKKGKIPSTYAICFCGRSDSLSQWRGYGGTEQGIALIFDRAKLVSILQRDDLTLSKIIYGTVTASDKMRRELKKELEDLERLQGGPGGLARRQLEQDVYSVVCKLLPRFKHVGFADEREWRFVIQPTDAIGDLGFRAKGNVLVPYMQVGPGSRFHLPLTKVIIGPGREQELTKRSVQLFLEQKGYSSTPVELSSVPFRT